MSFHNIEIVQITPCSIPKDHALERIAPRRIEDQAADYHLKFDFKTLSYDVFYSENKLVLSGPPLLGLENEINYSKVKIDGVVYEHKIHTQQLDRIQRNFIYLKKQPKNLTWEFNDFEFCVSVNKNYLDRFKDKKVLFTLSKNNKFEWIKDWIFYYKKIHNIDMVLFYDNDSTDYTIQQLSEYLKSQNLDIEILLVPWNFLYGPQGGSYNNSNKKIAWDSDFCQYGVFEHAKNRFLKYASGVINADIDELIVTPNSESIFSLLDNHKGLIYPGTWIESIPIDSNAETRFYNYYYKNKSKNHADFKWCINPSKIDDDIQWKVHSIRSVSLKKIVNVYYAHFKAINYNWKTQRTNTINFSSEKHLINITLYKALKSVFPELKKNPMIELLDKKEKPFWQSFFS